MKTKVEYRRGLTHWGRNSLLLAYLALFVGCLAYTYEEYGSLQAGKFYGTQPGYHKLSDYFEVEVQEYMMKFYYREPSTQGREQLGVIRVSWFDRSNYGPREMAYAISNDGTRLLYFDEPGVHEGKPLNQIKGVDVSNLYRFDATTEENLLIHDNIHRRAFGCLELPLNYIPFGIVHSISNIEAFVRSTEDDEISLDERRRSLLASGDEGRVCGPL